MKTKRKFDMAEEEPVPSELAGFCIEKYERTSSLISPNEYLKKVGRGSIGCKISVLQVDEDDACVTLK